MQLIQRVTSDPKQKRTITLADGSLIELTIEFIPMQYGWVIRNITYGPFVATNLNITNNFNILSAFKNLIPFGLACISQGPREPMLQEDFSSGYSSLYILLEDEMDQLEDYFNDSEA